MSGSARDLLVRGIAAAKAGDKEEACFYLEWVLRSDADRGQQVEAWWWLSEISDDPAEKRDCLENILAYDMGHGPARRSLAILDGRLDPEEVIDPSRRPLKPLRPQAAQPVQARQFTCPHCKGRLAFNPDGQSLACPYCHHQLSLAEAEAAGERVEEQDFVLALATAKGHSRAVTLQTFQCQSCSAAFVLAPTILSMSCPYCASAHVVKQADSRRLIEPEGIIPFGLTQGDASQALRGWLKARKLAQQAQTTTPSGLYVPVWTFDVGGELRWRYRTVESQHIRVKSVSKTGSRAIFFNDVLVPASHKFARLADPFDYFRLDRLVPYEAGYLADWPAETYQVSTAEASLIARERAYERARQDAELLGTGLFAGVEEMVFSSAGLVVESYKLILLPLWLARYHYQGLSYGLIVNGQTGQVTGKTPRGRFWQRLAGIFDL